MRGVIAAKRVAICDPSLTHGSGIVTGKLAKVQYDQAAGLTVRTRILFATELTVRHLQLVTEPKVIYQVVLSTSEYTESTLTLRLFDSYSQAS